MTTVADVLRQSGLSESEIARIDASAIAAFSNVLSTAEQAQRAAELAGRANTEFYETKIVPALTSWEAEQEQLEAERSRAVKEAAYFKAAAQAAGIIPGDENRDSSGRFVAGVPGSTPGSPTLLDPTQIAGRIGDVAGVISDIQWKYSTLFGKPLPVAPSELIKQADANGVDPATFAARKFNFSQREQELAKQAHQAEIDAATKMAVEANDRKWAERTGSNPDVRQAPGASKYAEVQRAVRAGSMPDPLKLTDQQRRNVTRQAIHKEIDSRESGD